MMYKLIRHNRMRNFSDEKLVFLIFPDFQFNLVDKYYYNGEFLGKLTFNNFCHYLKCIKYFSTSCFLYSAKFKH